MGGLATLVKARSGPRQVWVLGCGISDAEDRKPRTQEPAAVVKDQKAGQWAMHTMTRQV